MTSGIGNVDGYGYGYGNYGYGNYGNNNKNDAEGANNNPVTQNNYENTQVDPQKVMDFLAKNNYFIPVNTNTAQTENVGEVDAETQERIAGYMERFEEIYAIVEQEFGTELAPAVMDLVMDKLMGMV